MKEIKIISNPYLQQIEYKVFNGEWQDVSVENPNGKLREEVALSWFLPFHVRDILNNIVQDYYVNSKIKVQFEGTDDEFIELSKICESDEFVDKIHLERSQLSLNVGSEVLLETKKIFNTIKPILLEKTYLSEALNSKIQKVIDSLEDIVPICVFGNYSAGKSTFINALIGKEVLPSGGDPVTAKAFKIENIDEKEKAVIKFNHWDKEVVLTFEGMELIVSDSAKDDSMIIELLDRLSTVEFTNSTQKISETLNFINAYEKKDSTSTEIGNLIELQIHFSTIGILGSSKNKYVIFDTPGSNTASNDGHIEVLRDALDGFSNGIPVWVSHYESIDTMDNETLCNNILGIDALDKRFTMIVLNKADVSDLPENGFNQSQIKNILEFKSVEKMYASGIFFVSSIMGLGSKVEDNLNDKFYKKIFKLQLDSFTDKDDENYMPLYQYNIVPATENVKYTYESNDKDLIYVNSGLNDIEKEIEAFASKYSTYNKSQMVYSLLSDVIEKTTEKIDVIIKSREHRRESRIAELDSKKQELSKKIDESSAESVSRYYVESNEKNNDYVKNELKVDKTIDYFESVNEKYINENMEQYNIGEKEKEKINAKNSLISNLKNNIKGIQINNIKESISGIVQDTIAGSQEIINSQTEFWSRKKDMHKETTDEILNEVNIHFNNLVGESFQNSKQFVYKNWEYYSVLLKDELTKIVTESDALDDTQKDNLKKVIFEFKNYDNVVDYQIVFEKLKYLHGVVFGKEIFVYEERLNFQKLCKSFNKEINQKNMENTKSYNEECFGSFEKWSKELVGVIKDNMVSLNYELSDISEEIKDLQAEIELYESRKRAITIALNEIESLISFSINK